MEFTNKLLKRTSVRDFKRQKINPKHLEIIKEVINNSPTSVNHQQFSAIIIEDQKTKDFISKKNWHQQHIKDSTIFIIFLADRTIANEIIKNKKLKISNLMKEYEHTRSIVDATIAATYAQSSLISLGYGVTMVGGINCFASELQQLLNIPNTSFPIVGLSVGFFDKENELKPKMNKVFFEKYNKEELLKESKRYHEQMKKEHLKRNSKHWKDSLEEWNDKTTKIAKLSSICGKEIKKWKRNKK